MKNLLFIAALLIAFSSQIFGQAELCEDSEPFCTSSIYSFPAGVNTSSQPGPNYGCLTTQPNPAWYHMKIAVSGNITIKMFSTPSKDIDFICWGPFDDPYEPCVAALTSNKQVDCSYDSSPIEYCDIPNGQVGEYYILLITNFSNAPCDITFQKTGGSGETDCTIVPPPVSNNGPLCVHDNLMLYADTVNNATYFWSGPNGYSSTQQNPVIFNVDMNDGGTYGLIITVNGSPSDPVETSVAVSALPDPDFSYNDVCFGDTTYFMDLSTVDPPSSSITTYQWDFGDGNTANGPDQIHIYGNTGIYSAKLSTFTGLGQCERSETKLVNVYSAASVNAGNDITIPNGWTAQILGDVTGGSGDYDLLWEPENLLEDATIADPTTNALGSTQMFKLNVTDASSGCKSADSMTVIVTGGALAVSAVASPAIICQDDIVNLNAVPSGGSGNNTYIWTSAPAGFTADIKEPSDFPQVTTTYYVTVFDGQNTVEASTTVQVKEKPIANAGNNITINVGTSVKLDGSVASGGTGVYDFLWQPSEKLLDNTLIHPQTVVLETSTEYTFVVTDANGCISNPDQMVVLAGGDILGAFPTSSAQDNTICQGEEVTLTPNALGGSESYTYKWSDNSGMISQQENITVDPWETKTYTVEINDSFKIIDAEITIIVNHTPVVDLIPNGAHIIGTDTIHVCVRDTVSLDAGDPENPSSMNYLWSNAASSRKITASTNGNWVEFDSYWATAENPVTGCKGEGEVVVFFDFTACNIGIDEGENIDNKIKLSPNPTDNITTLSITDITGEIVISLTDITGKVIWTENDIVNSTEFSKEISLRNLPDGIYILSVRHTTGVYNQEVIKN